MLAHPQSRCQAPRRNFAGAAAKLTGTQANDVAAKLLTAFPALAALRKSGQCQFVNSSGQFRVYAVRGGALPAGLTDAAVGEAVSATYIALPPEVAERVEQRIMRAVRMTLQPQAVAL